MPRQAALLATGGLLLALAVMGCGGTARKPSASTVVSGSATPPSCPAAWKEGWQRLADRVRAPVYCPSWMPNPLDGQIGGQAYAGTYVTRSRAYLVSFLVSDPVGTQNDEVHVNFRGYPGEPSIPMCQDTLITKSKVFRPRVPCFSGARGVKLLSGKRVTVYTVNQGIDQWHVLYAWRNRGSLYAVSEHVIAPYTYAQVVRNLDRLVRGLVVVWPAQ